MFFFVFRKRDVTHGRLEKLSLTGGWDLIYPKFYRDWWMVYWETGWQDLQVLVISLVIGPLIPLPTLYWPGVVLVRPTGVRHYGLVGIKDRLPSQQLAFSPDGSNQLDVLREARAMYYSSIFSSIIVATNPICGFYKQELLLGAKY